MRRLLPLIALLALALLSGCAPSPATNQTTGVRKVSAEEAKRLLGAGYQAIDVRTRDEVRSGKVKGALNHDVNAGFETAIAALDKRGRYLVYCKSGNRSAKAVEMMRQAGFVDVADGGGYDALKAAGVPVE